MAFHLDFLESYDRESIAAELRRIAALRNKNSVSRRDIDRYGRLNSRTVMLKFGSLRLANEAAGLVPGRFTKATDEEFLQILDQLWAITGRLHGRSPRCHEVRQYGFPVSARTIAARFGSWHKALAAAAQFGHRTPPASPQKPAGKREGISLRTRFLIFRRDAYTCRICKRSGLPIELDHIIPLGRGGSNSPENLQTLCRDCNQGKGANLE